MPSTDSVAGSRRGIAVESPVVTVTLDPARRWTAAFQHRVEQRECRLGKVDHDLARRHADAARAELGMERRVAVDQDVTGPRTDAGRAGLGQRRMLVMTGHRSR